MKPWPVLAAALIVTAPARPAPACDRPVRIWLLPFQQLQPDSSLAYLEDALPALLTVALSQSDAYVVVDRQEVDRVLAEQSLTLEGLISQDTRHRVGKLLGATVMITGSFFREGAELLATMRAVDLETGIVLLTAEARGSAREPGALANHLDRRLRGALDGRAYAPERIDLAPVSNLHFMKGLGHYYSARYSHALAEFMLAAEDESSADVARLWLARTYLAERQFLHACLELTRLAGTRSAIVRPADVVGLFDECRKQLSPEDLKIVEGLAVRHVP
jgi:TolB-like protein